MKRQCSPYTRQVADILTTTSEASEQVTSAMCQCTKERQIYCIWEEPD